MRTAHVVFGISEEASGLSYSVPNLCQALRQQGSDVRLHVLGSVPPASASFTTGHRPIPVLKRLGLSSQLTAALREESSRSQVVHFHSLWTYPTIYPAWAVRKTRAKLVASPRGTLSAWALSWSRWRKRAIWWAFQRNALLRADLVHATAQGELEEVRAVGVRAPVAVIPNGISIPAVLPTTKPDGYRRLLFLSRIHPKKGIDSLLRVWGRLQSAHTDWELRIVGPMEGEYAQQLRRMVGELALDRVTFDGVLYGQAKLDAYQSAELFVLPTHSENFGLAVAEALANGVPVVVSQGAPWQGVEKEECGWWPAVSEPALEGALRQALSMGRTELAAMGQRGREWMQRDYSWSRVAAMMASTYRWLCEGGEKPDWVEVR